jgi:hypothetical protein
MAMLCPTSVMLSGTHRIKRPEHGNLIKLIEQLFAHVRCIIDVSG